MGVLSTPSRPAIILPSAQSCLLEGGIGSTPISRPRSMSISTLGKASMKAYTLLNSIMGTRFSSRQHLAKSQGWQLETVNIGLKGKWSLLTPKIISARLLASRMSPAYSQVANGSSVIKSRGKSGRYRLATSGTFSPTRKERK